MWSGEKDGEGEGNWRPQNQRKLRTSISRMGNITEEKWVRI